MAEEVDIGNIGGENGVASEATLRKLVAAMEKMSKEKGGTSADQSKKAQEAYRKSVKKSTEEIEDNTDALDDNTSAVKRSTSALGSLAGGALNALVAGIGAVTGSAVNLGTELLVGGDRLSDFAQHVPIVGGALSVFTGLLDRSIDALRNFSNVGISFNNSIETMIREQLQGSMSFEQFSESLMNNLPAIQILGTTMTNGAKEFTRISTQLRTGRVGQSLMNMGFTMNDINNALGSYTVLLRRSGRLQAGNDQQLIEGTERYLKEVDALAKATGLNRQEAERMIVNQQTDAQIRAIQREIEARGGNVEAFNAQVGLVENLGGTLGPAFKQLIDGIPDNELGEMLYAATDGAAAELMQQARRGEITTQEFYDRLAAMGPQIEAAFGDADFVGGLRRLSHPMAEIVDENYKLMEMTRKNFQEAMAEQLDTNATTSALALFEQNINRLRSEVLLPLVNTFFPAFERFMQGSFSQEKIQTYITNFTNFMREFAEDPQGKLREVFGNIRDFFFGYTDEAGNQIEGVFQTLPAIVSDGFNSIFNNPTVREGITNGLNAVFDLMERTFISSYLVRNLLGLDEQKVSGSTAERIIAGDEVSEEDRQQMLDSIIDPDGANFAARFKQAAGSILGIGRGEDGSRTFSRANNRELNAFIGAIRRDAEAYATDPNSITPERLREILDFQTRVGQMPERAIGTLAATGKLVEPKTTYAKIHQGERVLSPDEASAYNSSLTNGQKGVTINQEGVISAINQLNMNIGQAIAVLTEIERNGKGQIRALAQTGSAVY